MYNIKAFTSKFFTSLHIPSERDIRALQLQQVQRALKQPTDSTKRVAGAQLNLFQRNWWSNTPQKIVTQ